MTLHIDRLTLRLPPEHEVRATQLARRIAHSLREVPTNGHRRIAHLNAGRIAIQSNTSDADLVHRIRSAIDGQLRESKQT